MKDEDYKYLYSQLSTDKVPTHLKKKIEKGIDFTDTEKQEILSIITLDKSRYGEWLDIIEEEMYCPDQHITITRTTQTCSYCKTRIGFIGTKLYLYDNYCSYCGARMNTEEH